MSKTWTFIGGMLAGITSMFAAAAVAVELECYNVARCYGQRACKKLYVYT